MGLAELLRDEYEKKQIPRKQEFITTLGEVVEKLKASLPPHQAYAYSLLLWSGIIQAAKNIQETASSMLCLPIETELRILHTNPEIYSLQKDALHYLMGIYSQQDAPLPESLKNLPHEIMATPIAYPIKFYKMIYSRPTDAGAMAQKMHQALGGSDILLIPIGNSGLHPGISVFHQYISAGSRNSRLHPVRMSRKMGDVFPVLSQTELEELRSEAEGRKVVILDDLSQLNTTLSKFGTFITRLLETDIYQAIMARKTYANEAYVFEPFTPLMPGILDRISSDSARRGLKQLLLKYRS
ncbi:hypothetical protein HYY72_04645 [Candidatus Woesearchaeota archaeon]|nr:hypothetical protein [Candidatus Woesearchaeota archaeon]